VDAIKAATLEASDPLMTISRKMQRSTGARSRHVILSGGFDWIAKQAMPRKCFTQAKKPFEVEWNRTSGRMLVRCRLTAQIGVSS
jgi:hypothetical protein